MSDNGLFVVLEGSDGSGKGTQLKLLKERLRAIGYDVAVFDFPRYSQESSYFVRQYLAGAYGPSTKISPYTASLFYALDRFAAAKDIREAVSQGKIVLADRYVGSNMAHQGAKFADPVEQRGFFVWEDNLEYQLLGIPRPDISFFLRVPAEVSKNLIDKRATRTGSKLDGHEKDANFLKKSLATYDVLCRLFPKDFKAVDCAKGGQLLGVAEINNLLWDQLKPLLPAEKPHRSHSVVVTLGGSDDRREQPTSESPKELRHHLTNASLLLRLQLQRGQHVGVTPELSGWPEQKYTFYTPRGLPRELEGHYKATMGALASIHQQLAGKLTSYFEKHLLDGAAVSPGQSVSSLILPLTPLSAISDFYVRVEKKRLASLTSQMLSSDVGEVQWAAKQLYIAARQRWPEEFNQPLESTGDPELINSIITKLADELLPKDYSSNESIKLLEARPRLEFDLLAESIYPYSTLSLEEITQEVAEWPYQQKLESLRLAAGQASLLRKVSYKTDMITDQLVLSDLAANVPLKGLQVQSYTPRYGFDVPEIIEDAGADDLYNDAFDLSLKLYSSIQAADREDLAAYATLLGHKVRWQFRADASAMKQIVGTLAPRDKQLAQSLTDSLAEAHPLLWEVILDGSPAVQRPKNGKNRVKKTSQRHKSSKSK